MTEVTLANEVLGDETGLKLQQWEAWRDDKKNPQKEL